MSSDLTVKAAGQRQRSDNAAADPFGIRSGGIQVRTRGGHVAAVEADHGGDAVVHAGRPRFLQRVVQGLHLGQCGCPLACVEHQLAEGAVRLGQPD